MLKCVELLYNSLFLFKEVTTLRKNHLWYQLKFFVQKSIAPLLINVEVLVHISLTLFLSISTFLLVDEETIIWYHNFSQDFYPEAKFEFRITIFSSKIPASFEIIVRLGYNSGHIAYPPPPLFYPHRSNTLPPFIWCG